MDKHYENLARLYLRLKGFLVSNLIIHSERQGDSKSELDIVAIKMPFHSQEYRWVKVEDFLRSSDNRIEILIADVKNYSKIEDVEFNKGLRKDQGSIKQLIDWIGIYKTVDQDLINKFEKYLNLHRIKKWDDFAEFDEDLEVGKFRFKFTFFCPAIPEWNGGRFKYIHGEEMINFIWECLNESTRIETCSRRYDFGGWNELEKYIRLFKGDKQKVTLNDFESYCKQYC